MPPKPRNPESHQPVTSLAEFDREARKLAGLPEYSMDDPGRPFTEEYDPPKNVLTEPTETLEPVLAAEPETEDTTPSADNRELYQRPTPARLGEIRKQKALEHIRNMKLVVKAAQEEVSKDIKTSA